MIRSIITHGNPILRDRCVAADLSDTSSLAALVNDLRDTLVAVSGAGLAANQIGAKERVFVVRANDKSIVECINPQVITAYELHNVEREGCLSIPGVGAPTTRYRYVHLRYTSLAGEVREAVFLDQEAVAVQHEIDHLDGKLYIDKLSTIKRALLLSKSRAYVRAQQRS